MPKCKQCAHFLVCANLHGQVTADTEITNIDGEQCFYYEKSSQQLIGDGTKIEPFYNMISLKTTIADELEYDCWNLFRKYCNSIGFKILQLEKDGGYIDFSIAKKIQDNILRIFLDEGIDIKFINDI